MFGHLADRSVLGLGAPWLGSKGVGGRWAFLTEAALRTYFTGPQKTSIPGPQPGQAVLCLPSP